jgi:Retrotransposon gag protein
MTLYYKPHNEQVNARDGLKKLRQKHSVVEYANEFNKLVLKLLEMTEDEEIYSFISGLQTEVKLHRPNDLQTAKEIADRADTLIFQAKRFSRGRGGSSLEIASGNWPNHDDEAMKLGAARLTDSEREKYMKEGKCFRCGQNGHRPTSITRMGHPKRLDSPGNGPPGKEENYGERTKREQKNGKKKRTSALYSRYDAFKETHGSEDKYNEELSLFGDWNRKISKRNRNRKTKKRLLQGRERFECTIQI